MTFFFTYAAEQIYFSQQVGGSEKTVWTIEQEEICTAERALKICQIYLGAFVFQ